MNVELLRQIQKEVAAEPLRMKMTTWTCTNDFLSPCRSTACIAGWALAIREREKIKEQDWASIVKNVQSGTLFKTGRDVQKEAQKELGLTLKQTTDLFFVTNWPEEFRIRYMGFEKQMTEGGHDLYSLRKLRKGQAQVVIDRIEHLIETEITDTLRDHGMYCGVGHGAQGPE